MSQIEWPCAYFFSTLPVQINNVCGVPAGWVTAFDLQVLSWVAQHFVVIQKAKKSKKRKSMKRFISLAILLLALATLTMAQNPCACPNYPNQEFCCGICRITHVCPAGCSVNGICPKPEPKEKAGVAAKAAAQVTGASSSSGFSGCCWNGDCCVGVEFCCDDCNGSCTCSVNGKCS